MEFDKNKIADSVVDLTKDASDGLKKVADETHKATKEFHKNYVSKITPDMGKYGNVVTFAAEMIPGVSEYNALKEGDWKAFAIASGIDIAAIGIGAFSAGAGYAAVKGASGAAKASIKGATKELGKDGAEKAVKSGSKEIVEKGGKEISEKAVKGTEKTVCERIYTKNENLFGKRHSETGVEFKLKTFTDDLGKRKEAVVPDFPSKLPDIRLPESLWKGSEAQHRSEAMSQIKNLFEKKPEIFKDFNKIQVDSIKVGRVPDGYVLHHDLPNGTMKLVEKRLHDATGHSGGMSLWGRGY